MPKTIKTCFYKNLTFSKLMLAHKRARKNKVYKNEIIDFEINLENNITNLLHNIQSKKYRLGTYKTFKIYEPKERVIKALPYVDRIVHQWYVEEFIKPYILPRFINNTFACIPNRGTHKAVDTVQQYLKSYQHINPNFWILKCDISKFFYNINPHILYDIMKKYISDKELLNFTKLLIFDGRNKEECVAIPIGNYTSQFFANIYLNELDQYVKRILKVKYYVRYMDDFILLLDSKKMCIKILNDIEIFLEKNLQLKLNDKSRYYPNKMGVNFCGYRIFSTHRLLRLNSKKNIKKKVKKWNHLYLHNKLNLNHCMLSLNSWKGHANHCNSYKLQQKVFNSCYFLYNTNAFKKIENDLIFDLYNFKEEV